MVNLQEGDAQFQVVKTHSIKEFSGAVFLWLMQSMYQLTNEWGCGKSVKVFKKSWFFIPTMVLHSTPYNVLQCRNSLGDS